MFFGQLPVTSVHFWSFFDLLRYLLVMFRSFPIKFQSLPVMFRLLAVNFRTMLVIFWSLPVKFRSLPINFLSTSYHFRLISGHFGSTFRHIRSTFGLPPIYFRSLRANFWSLPVKVITHTIIHCFNSRPPGRIKVFAIRLCPKIFLYILLYYYICQKQMPRALFQYKYVFNAIKAIFAIKCNHYVLI